MNEAVWKRPSHNSHHEVPIEQQAHHLPGEPLKGAYRFVCPEKTHAVKKVTQKEPGLCCKPLQGRKFPGAEKIPNYKLAEKQATGTDVAILAPSM